MSGKGKTLDPFEFRDGQRAQWNAAAMGWRRWRHLMDASTSHISERLVELAGIEPGDKVLDVAAGYGEPSLTAARKTGPGGVVIATDISAQMIACGRERAAEAGLSNIQFVEKDAGSLVFPEDSFDAALSRWGIIFEPDGKGAARRVRRFLKPGGRFAISSWGPPERVPLFAIPMRTAMQRLDVPPPPPGTPGPLSRPTPEAIGGLLEAGGFSDVQVEEADVTFEWESAEAFTAYLREISPPITALLAPHPPDVQEETWAAIAQAAGDARPLRLSNLVLLAVGRA